jgi:tetratricopeptide (TPR) repeat protein
MNSRLLHSAAFVLTLLGASAAFAVPELVGDSPETVLSIEELSRSGMHFEALSKAQAKGEGGLSLAEQLSAARSAWALGLADVARKYWEGAFAKKEFDGLERSREMLARAILELQEGRPFEAREIAERTAQTVPPSDLRAQLWMVVGEALRIQQADNQAEIYYKKAFQEASPTAKSEAAYLLGECQYRLGKLQDSRYSFTAVQSASKHASQALQRLIELDLSQNNFEGVVTWVEEGRTNVAGTFDSSWVSYAYVKSLLALDRVNDAQRELGKSKVRYSEHDSWNELANAAMEAKRIEDHLGTSADEAPVARAQLRDIQTQVRGGADVTAGH